MKHTKCYIAGYPRPQLVRSDWKDLCGEWKFAFGEEASAEDAFEEKLPRVIRVPFAYECKASGIGEETPHSTVWYSRTIEGKTGKRAILHFDGADYNTEVYINRRLVGRHRGAYSRFSFDVTDYLTEEKNILAVRCDDENHPAQVRGKQRWKKENFGCWYVQTTGIYKSVWMEYVEDAYLTGVKITPSLKDYTVRFDASVSAPAEDVEIRFAISFDGRPIRTVCVSAADIENSVSVKLDSANLTYQVEQWSVGSPALYDVEITVYKAGRETDKTGSYFGLREFVARDGKLLLNNIPF